MEYLAHISEERKQTLKDHLEGTAKRAESFAAKFGCGDWGYCCGMLHDVGKYSEAFQKYLSGLDGGRVDHSTAGAKLCEEKGGVYKFLEFCIAGHHAGLADQGGSSSSSSEASLSGRLLKSIEDFGAYKNEIDIPKLTSQPFDPRKVRDPAFSLSVFIRMLFSCLVDADYLDTEYFMKDGDVDRNSGESIRTLYDRLFAYVSGWLENHDTGTIDGRRSEILRNCLDHGTDRKGLFRLTVPTGGGKTLSSLAFALRHAVEHDLSRVIYVIPYTSIIEQNARIFKKILGEENVLEDHYNADYKTSEELSPMYLASENWDKPVVVTTNVQFFESLFSNRPSKCRKLHNIADSVIIFDEAQMLPNDYLKPCIAMMEELITDYGVSLVLCTATQPSLQNFFSPNLASTELCPRIDEQFSFFKRVMFEDIGTVSEDELVDKLQPELQALCIVNTRKRAQSVYSKLKAEGVYHLSTSMYPEHRKRVLETIKQRLREGKRCVVISTSLVEAGVDLDFGSVYRELSGADSMIQAAGRCNREGKRALNESIVSIFSFEDRHIAPSQSQYISVTRALIKEGIDIASKDGIEEYFKRLYHVKGTALDKKDILGRFGKVSSLEFASAAKDFKIIENDAKTVFVAKTDDAKDILYKMRTFGPSKKLMRKAGQYCVQVYENDLVDLYDAGCLRLISSELEDFYLLVNEEKYTDDMGLQLDNDSGMAMFY